MSTYCLLRSTKEEEDSLSVFVVMVVVGVGLDDGVVEWE